MEDGIKVVKRHGRWYFESWLKGYRMIYRIIGEQEAQEVIKNLKL